MIQYYVRIDPFSMLSLTYLKGTRMENEHGEVVFSGMVPEDVVDDYLAMGLNKTWVEMFAVDISGEEELWFHGCVADIFISTDAEVNILTATVKTGSYLMDASLHTRSYQTPGMTYNTVLNSYTRNYPKNGFIMKKGDGEPIDTLIMQYRESDWAYSKRLASHFQTVLLPDCLAGGTKYYFGISSSSPKAFVNTKIFEMRNNASEYETKLRMGVGLSHMDAVYYLHRTKDIYQLGDCIIFNDKPLYVCRIDTRLIREDLYHTYHLKTLEGFQVPKDYNLQGTGVSFYANITAVEKDIVQITIQDDENKDECGVRWFPYSTPYSTPDGTGFYCMPEIGDAVRMYLPTEDEAVSYVISSTHLTTRETASDERVNPDFKSIMNKQKKEVLFTPNSLIFTNNNGMSLEILDEEGIKIISDHEIVFESDEAVKLISVDSTIEVASPELILLEQDETITQLQENVAFKGAQVHLD